MSDKYTEVSTPSGGIGLWGHVTREDAITELRAHYEREAATAAAVLAEIEAHAAAIARLRRGED